MYHLKKLKLESILRALPWVLVLLGVGVAFLLKSDIPLFNPGAELNKNLLFFGILITAAAVMLFAMCVTGVFQRQAKARFKKYCSASLDDAYNIMNGLMDQKAVNGLRIYGNHLLMRQGLFHYLFDSKDILWVYQQDTQERFLFLIPMGITHSVMFMLANGKSAMVKMPEDKIQPTLDSIRKDFPKTAVGYSEELEKLYFTNLKAFRKEAASQRQKS